MKTSFKYLLLNCAIAAAVLTSCRDTTQTDANKVKADDLKKHTNVIRLDNVELHAKIDSLTIKTAEFNAFCDRYGKQPPFIHLGKIGAQMTIVRSTVLNKDISLNDYWNLIQTEKYSIQKDVNSLFVQDKVNQARQTIKQ